MIIDNSYLRLKQHWSMKKFPNFGLLVSIRSNKFQEAVSNTFFAAWIIKPTKNEIKKEKDSNGNLLEKPLKLFSRKSFTMLKDNLSWVNIISMVLEKQEKEGINKVSYMNFLTVIMKIY